MREYKNLNSQKRGAAGQTAPKFLVARKIYFADSLIQKS